jgi:hypothetical protein
VKPKNTRTEKSFLNVRELGEAFLDNASNDLDFRNKAHELFKSDSPEERAQLAYTLELCKGGDSGRHYFLNSGNEFVEQYIQNNIMHLSRPDSIHQLKERAEKMIALKAHWKRGQG